ncbi:MAG: zf-HC2 domain-containing protein [Planctomycetes bacterium]|nr:zf-HC2 domain-containing protein [Planctomycetota bacterium]
MDTASSSLASPETRSSGRIKSGLPITCADVREVLSQYAAGSLSSETTSNLDAHLETCDTCARELIAMRQEDELLSDALSELRPNASFRAKVSNLCTEVHKHAEGLANSIPMRGWAIFRWGFALVGLAVFLGVSIWSMPQAEALNVPGAETVAAADRSFFFWINGSVFAMALFLLLGSNLVNHLENWLAAKIGNRPERGASRLEVLTLEAMGICGVVAASLILLFIRGA